MMTLIRFAVAVAGVIATSARAAHADCNPLLSETIKQALQPTVANIGCLNGFSYKVTPFGPTVRIAIDKRGHRIDNLCYDPGGAMSTLKTTIQLQCKTSDKALITASISEKVHATVTVRNSDCQITDYDVTTSGEIGKIIASTADLFSLVRPPLQDALDAQCN